MSLWDILGRAWRKFEQLAHAIEYDEHTDTAARIQNLEQLQQSSSAAIADGEKHIAALSNEVAALSEQVASRATSAG